VLFAAMSLLWGVPYLFIKEAVDSFAPAAVVAGRTLGGAALLLPLAVHRGALRPALARWRWVLAFGAIEMAGPFMLLSHAEQTLPSGLTGLLVATVPLFSALVGLARGDRGVLRAARMGGLLIGFAGVALIVWSSGGDGRVDAVSIAEVLLVAVLYAIAPFIVAGGLRDVPPLGSISLSLAAVGVVYLPIALITQQGAPTTRSIAALVALAVICTAIAFVVFFALIAEAGPSRATLFTYVNPVVALGLGIVVLDEPMTAGLLLGFPVILAGCWLAAGGRRQPAVEAAVEAEAAVVPVEGSDPDVEVGRVGT